MPTLQILSNDPRIIVVFVLLGLALILVIVTYFVWRYTYRANPGVIEDSIEELNQAETADARYKILDKVYLQYIDENLKRSKSIFRLTYTIVVSGFLLIFTGVIIAFIPALSTGNSESPISDNASSTAATLSVLAGLVTNFIATIILIIFRSSNRQNTEYFHSVEESLERQAAFDILTRIEASNNNNSSDKVLDAQLEVMRLVFGGDVTSKE